MVSLLTGEHFTTAFTPLVGSRPSHMPTQRALEINPSTRIWTDDGEAAFSPAMPATLHEEGVLDEPAAEALTATVMNKIDYASYASLESGMRQMLSRAFTLNRSTVAARR